MDKRIFIERHEDFREEGHFARSLSQLLKLPQLQGLRRVHIYDVFDCPEDLWDLALNQVFSDPVSDAVWEALPPSRHAIISELLPGQFDQRADSAEQCLRALHPGFEATRVLCAQAWLLEDDLAPAALQSLKNYLINPLESREKNMAEMRLPRAGTAAAVPFHEDFNALSPEALAAWHGTQQLAMSLADLRLVQDYFRSQQRPPSETEIRLLDTYWSDHCRHTTFATALEKLRFPDSDFGRFLQRDFEKLQAERAELHGEALASRPLTLMELATFNARKMRKKNQLQDVEFSAEINACSVRVSVDVAGKEEEWLLQFKNETHNHPTEIEPFGGAATCVGGAIRDPLSGRAYVYQSLRISGAADPREALQDTLPGKLPQSRIATESAAGYASYGNQIGLATGQVVEYYHEGYKAKHMELGAVVGAVPLERVKREEPQAGDVVLLIGGATGRDGCGGATGSSKTQHQGSLQEAAAEVQKGNAPEERKLQRLFLNPEFSKRVKRCNDFGAGGVSVAVGELAAGLDIDLDAVPVKYEGLSGTELAISESQERMAVVIDAADEALMKEWAAAENLNASTIARVNGERQLRMSWRGQNLVTLSRDFLDSNGAAMSQPEVILADVDVSALKRFPEDKHWPETLKKQLQTLKFADQRGLGDRFDHSVGAACVLLPYGGRTQRSPSEAGVYLLPAEETQTASILAHGFHPELAAASPFHGGLLAVVDATARLVACGGDARRAHYSLQEYFRRLKSASDWGQPVAALLGACHALSALGRAAIGGKDSMSGSYGDLHVPPTLVAFAVTTLKSEQVKSPEWKAAGHRIYRLRCPQNEWGIPDWAAFQANNLYLWENNARLASIRAIRHGGLLQALYECSLGNDLGVRVQAAELFREEYGAYLLSSEEALPPHPHLEEIGTVTASAELHIHGETVPLAELYALATAVLEDVYPLHPEKGQRREEALPLAHQPGRKALPLRHKQARPRVCVPVFPGTNSELDTARAFRAAGARSEEVVIRNRSQADLEASLKDWERLLQQSQILALAGGFSAGDEPDGSGKFIANLLASPRIRAALEDFLARDGLILGICNGFQALIKCGLLPDGHLIKPQRGAATLTHNDSQRHISRVVTTVVANNHSPWLANFAIGEAHDVECSHGEGRFVASPETLQSLLQRGQIAFQYADPNSLQPSMALAHNPNGSLYAVEGLISPCGRILGKMGHSERQRPGTHRNFPHFRAQNIFAAGVQAFH